MNKIAVIFVIVGIFVFITSLFLRFKPIKISFDEVNENKDLQDNECDDEKDFEMLLNNAKSVFKFIGVILIIIGIALYVGGLLTLWENI